MDPKKNQPPKGMVPKTTPTGKDPGKQHNPSREKRKKVKKKRRLKIWNKGKQGPIFKKNTILLWLI